MGSQQFRTRAQLERQIDRARQLRAEALATGAAWSATRRAVSDAPGLLRRAVAVTAGALALPRVFRRSKV